jgi:hypothetical protein
MSYPHNKCAAPGCHKPMREFSYYCRLHTPKMHRTGSATGRLLRKSEIHTYRAEIAPVLDALGDHRSVVAALQYLDALLQGNGLSREERPWIDRLRNAGVEPSLLLLNLAAVVGATIYLQLEDGAALDANLGNILVRSVPAPRRGRKPSGCGRYSHCPPTVYRPLGRRVREVLTPLLLRLWEIYEANHQRQAALRHELSARVVATLGVTDGA